MVSRDSFFGPRRALLTTSGFQGTTISSKRGTSSFRVVWLAVRLWVGTGDAVEGLTSDRYLESSFSDDLRTLRAMRLYSMCIYIFSRIGFPFAV